MTDWDKCLRHSQQILSVIVEASFTTMMIQSTFYQLLKHIAWLAQMKHFIDDTEYGAVYTGYLTPSGHLPGTAAP